MEHLMLLTHAAGAVGRELKLNAMGELDARCYWNPLVSDGDALRLAVDLNMAIDIQGRGFEGKRQSNKVEIVVSLSDVSSLRVVEYILEESCTFEITRLAIVRMAALCYKHKVFGLSC